MKLTNTTLTLTLLTALCAPGCKESTTAPATRRGLFEVKPNPAVFNVLDYGALPNDGIDDRAAFLAAIDGADGVRGGVVWVPSGTYDIDQAAGQYITLPANTQIHGQHENDTVIRQMPGAQAAARIFYVAGDNVLLSGFTMDGRKDLQSANDQRHAVFADTNAVAAPVTGLRIDRVTARNFSGDAFYLGKVDNVVISNSRGYSNGRSGVVVGGAASDIMVLGGVYYDNAGQQIDMEPGTGSAALASRIVVNGVSVTAPAAGNYAISAGGSVSDGAYFGRDLVVANSTIVGGINIVWARRVLVSNNTITAVNDKHGVRVYRTTEGVTIQDNTITVGAGTVTELAGVAAVATGSTQRASSLLIRGNVINVTRTSLFGVFLHSSDSVDIENNTITGPRLNAGFGTGVYYRCTVTGADAARLAIRGNTIKDFKTNAVWVTGLDGSSAATCKLYSLQLTNNTIANTFGGSDAYMTTDLLHDAGGLTVNFKVIAGNTCTNLDAAAPFPTCTAATI